MWGCERQALSRKNARFIDILCRPLAQCAGDCRACTGRGRGAGPPRAPRAGGGGAHPGGRGRVTPKGGRGEGGENQGSGRAKRFGLAPLSQGGGRAEKGGGGRAVSSPP